LAHKFDAQDQWPRLRFFYSLFKEHSARVADGQLIQRATSLYSAALRKK